MDLNQLAAIFTIVEGVFVLIKVLIRTKKRLLRKKTADPQL
jgi:hypothetical protein